MARKLIYSTCTDIDQGKKMQLTNLDLLNIGGIFGSATPTIYAVIYWIVGIVIALALFGYGCELCEKIPEKIREKIGLGRMFGFVIRLLPFAVAFYCFSDVIKKGGLFIPWYVIVLFMYIFILLFIVYDKEKTRANKLQKEIDEQ